MMVVVVVVVQIGPQLVSLKLTGARIIRDDTFRDMVRTFESMRYLSLDGTFYVKSQAINALAKAGQQLQEVRACSGSGLHLFLARERCKIVLSFCATVVVLTVCFARVVRVRARILHIRIGFCFRAEERR